MLGSIFKIFSRFEVILILLAIFVIVITISVYRTKTVVEGFYPLNEARINMGEMGKRRYNAYADIQDPTKEPIIPSGPAGDPLLFKLLGSNTYEGDTSRSAGAGLVSVDELTFRSPPEQTELLARIKMCETLKSWDCEKLNDPDFERFCGICTENGQDHKGNPHTGGLYIDVERKRIEIEAAKNENRQPKFLPTVGVCKGKFLLTRPLCDKEKDRDDCSKYINFDTQDSRDKCGMCVYNNKMLYIGDRGQKDTNYALKTKPVIFKTNLKFAVSNHEEATVGVFKNVNQQWVQIQGGSYLPNTGIYYIVVEGQENQEFKIRISYPEYAGYSWSKEDLKRVEKLSNPKRLPIVRAMYGPWLNDYTKDDPRAKDVTEYVKTKFNIKDCGKTAVSISNDGLGGDPNPGIYKQLRLVYGDNGTDFAYSFGGEGQQSKPVQTDNYDQACPTGVAPSEAEKLTCETDADGNTIEGRVYTQGRNTSYPGAGNAFCVTKIDGKPRGIVGMWESQGRVPRSVPLDISVKQVNGFDTTTQGPSKLGTLKGSKYFKDSMPISKAPGIPGYLFWFWAKDRFMAKVEFTVVIPATLRDPTVQEDISLCPMGPIVSTPEAATRLKAGACEQLVDGQPQGPGSFSDNCIQSLFIAAGCKTVGKAYPSNATKKAALTKNQDTGDNLELDDILNNLDDLNSIATTGTNSNRDTFEEKTVEKYALDCLGEIKKDPCDGAFAKTGPHTPQCLDYLFRNAGAANQNIGQTYPGMFNRSSGTGATDRVPVMYCQRAGDMSPIGIDGKFNYKAISKANANGGVSEVKEFYRKIHYEANYNKNSEPQKKALKQCYGIGVTPKPVACPVKVCNNSLLPQNVSLINGNKIGSITHNGDYRLSFKINVKGIVETNWGSIIHFTKTGRDCCGFGDRGPGIWFYPNSLKLYIILGDSTQGGDWGLRSVDLYLPANKESTFVLTCKGNSISVVINGLETKLTQPGARSGGTFDIYAADPWYAPAKADLKDLCFVPG